MGIYGTTVTEDESVTSSFSTGVVHLHNLNAGSPTRVSGQKFVGRLGTLFIHLSSVSTSPAATKLTVRVARDSNGNELVVPDVEAAIVLGIADTTKSGVAIDIDVPYVESNNTDSMYVFVKTDAGTATMFESTFTWSDE